MDKDLIAAQQLQIALIHNRHRRFGRFDFTALVENAGRIGGNLAGVFAIGTRQICPRQPHDILQSINQIMLKDVTTDQFHRIGRDSLPIDISQTA